MPLIIVIYGASGSGKSTLMELLLRCGQYSVHIKGTDRPPRRQDGIEIRCVDHVEAPEYDYIYQTYGSRYGIQRSQIDAAIASNRHHFIICNDLDVIRALKHDYPDRVRVVFHYFDAPPEKFRAIQMARGIPDNEIELRLAKTEDIYRAFVREHELFDDVLYNRYGDNPEDLHLKIERILERLAAPAAARSADAHARLDQLARELNARLSAHPGTAPRRSNSAKV